MNEENRKVAIIAFAIGVWAMVTPSMWRDLRARGATQVRGPKWLWWIASSNLTGSVAYWLCARKDA
jgi:hypothetical protein